MSSTLQARIITLFTVVAIISSAFIGCAPENSEKEAKPRSSQVIEGLHFSSGFSDERKDRVSQDLLFLKTIKFGTSTACDSFKQIMKLQDLSSDSVFDWVQSKLHVIVDENFDATKNLYKVKSLYNSLVTEPVLFSDSFALKKAGKNDPKVIMANIGTEHYIRGKRNNYTPVLDISGVGKVVIDSPLAGVVIEGEGLFTQDFASLDDIDYVIFRDATYIHELTHELGNDTANSLGFEHEKCGGPKYTGKAVYVNEPACDANLNGPYFRQALFIKCFLDSNKTLSPQVVKSLDTLYLDNVGRILITNPTTAVLNPKHPDLWDDTPEKKK